MFALALCTLFVSGLRVVMVNVAESCERVNFDQVYPARSLQSMEMGVGLLL